MEKTQFSPSSKEIKCQTLFLSHTEMNSVEKKEIQISPVFCEASSKLKLKQQFTVNCSLTPCYSSHKRYLRSTGSCSVLHRFRPFVFFRPDKDLDSSPRRTPPEKTHRIQGFFFPRLHQSADCLLSFMQLLPPSFFLSFLRDRTRRVSCSATVFCLPSHLSKQIKALGHKTPYFLPVMINPSNTVPTSRCQQTETQYSAEHLSFAASLGFDT